MLANIAAGDGVSGEPDYRGFAKTTAEARAAESARAEDGGAFAAAAGIDGTA